MPGLPGSQCNLRHKESWEIVEKHVDTYLKVWTIKAEQTVLPTLLPWLEDAFESQGFVREQSEERIVLWISLPTCGVVSASKSTYFLNLITGLLTAKATNATAIVLSANRAMKEKKKNLI